MPQSYMDSQAIFVDRDAMIGLKRVTAQTGDATLTQEDSFGINYCTKTSATQTFTLPAATGSGREYTFVVASAAGEVLINGGASDVFNIKASEGGAAVATAAGTGVKNTAATNVVGDRITLVDVATNVFYAIAQSGIWASQ